MERIDARRSDGSSMVKSGPPVRVQMVSSSSSVVAVVVS